MKNNHENNLYIILLTLSRNIFFYKNIKLPDNFETRIYLMFIHFSIILIIFKEKGQKFSQKSYDLLFHNIENNLRELGFGDVAVNAKMKSLFSEEKYFDIFSIKISRNLLREKIKGGPNAVSDLYGISELSLEGFDNGFTYIIETKVI